MTRRDDTRPDPDPDSTPDQFPRPHGDGHPPESTIGADADGFDGLPELVARTTVRSSTHVVVEATHALRRRVGADPRGCALFDWFVPRRSDADGVASTTGGTTDPDLDDATVDGTTDPALGGLDGLAGELLTRRGARLPVSVRTAPYERDGETAGAHVLFVDLSAEARHPDVTDYRSMLAGVDEGVFVLDGQGVVSEVNSTLLSLAAVDDPDVLLGSHFESLLDSLVVPGPDHMALETAIEGVLRGPRASALRRFELARLGGPPVSCRLERVTRLPDTARGGRTASGSPPSGERRGRSGGNGDRAGGGGDVGERREAPADHRDDRDHRDDPVALVGTVRDESESILRRRHLRVLNRLVRDSLRTDLADVAETAAELERRLGDAETNAGSSSSTVRRRLSVVRDLARRWEAFGARSHGVDRAFAVAAADDPLDVADALSLARVAVERRRPGATVDVDVPPRGRSFVDVPLDQVLFELCENAVVHAACPDPVVTVVPALAADSVTVRVSDEGPGLSTEERAILETGAEHPTVPKRCFGLWLVREFVSRANGTLSVVERDGAGTVVEVTVPTVGGPETA